jgi:CheY-like chemotaxis protein
MTHSEPPKQKPMLWSAVEPSPLKILLVEDNLTNQKVALKQLQTLGYSAKAVPDGRRALETITQSIQAPYELVLMDCQMPVMDGYEAAQAIRVWEGQASKPKDRIVIIAMTASDLPQDRERAIAAGMDDFISKPVRRNDLDTVLQRWSQLIFATQGETGNQPKTGVAMSESHDMGSAKVFRPHLDLDHLHLLSDNCPEFELELLQLFVEDCMQKLEHLHQAIALQDFRLVEQIAHHIKGASANVGAKVMHFAADQLEAQASQKQFSYTDPLLDDLVASLHQIKEFVAYAQ